MRTARAATTPQNVVEGDSAEDEEHCIEGGDETQPAAVVAPSVAFEDRPRRLDRGNDNRNENRKEENGQQDLPGPGVDGHGGEDGPDGGKTNGGEQGQQPELQMPDGQVEERGEDREREGFDHQQEDEAAQHLADVEDVASDGAEHQSLDAAILFLQGEGAGEAHGAREDEG